MTKKISHSMRQMYILQHCLSFLMIVLTCSGCAVNRDSADKVVAEQQAGTRYSKNSLMVFYDTHIGKEPLLKAFKKMNCEVLHEYRLSIIRKTKRSEKIKRSDVFRKTKCSFFDFPTHNLKTPQKTLGRFKFLNHKNLTHSSRTLRSHYHQAVALFALNCSRICVHFRDSV